MSLIDRINANPLPFAQLLGIESHSAEADALAARMLIRPELCTMGGVAHGGAIMSFADTLGAAAAFINLPADAKGTTTIESKDQFRRRRAGQFDRDRPRDPRPSRHGSVPGPTCDQRLAGGAVMRLGCRLGLVVLMMGGAWADAQTATNMAALKGLAPVSALANTTDGKAALASNFTVTGGIQTGAIRQPTLMPFAEQQQQALRDAFITDGNLTQLADGLGATLGAAYQARAHYLDRERFTSISKAVSDVIAYANSTSRIGFERRQIFLRQRHDETAKSRSPTRPWRSSRTSTVRRIHLHAYGLAGMRRHKTGISSVPDRSRRTSAPIVGPDYFMFEPVNPGL